MNYFIFHTLNYILIVHDIGNNDICINQNDVTIYVVLLLKIYNSYEKIQCKIVQKISNFLELQNNLHSRYKDFVGLCNIRIEPK